MYRVVWNQSTTKICYLLLFRVKLSMIILLVNACTWHWFGRKYIRKHICRWSPLHLILLHLPLSLTLNGLIHKHRLFFLFKILLSKYLPLFQKKSIDGGPETRSFIEIFASLFYLSSIESALASDLVSFVGSSLGKTSSWPYDGGIWKFASSFALVTNYSTRVSDMY